MRPHWSSLGFPLSTSVVLRNVSSSNSGILCECQYCLYWWGHIFIMQPSVLHNKLICPSQNQLYYTMLLVGQGVDRILSLLMPLLIRIIGSTLYQFLSEGSLHMNWQCNLYSGHNGLLERGKTCRTVLLFQLNFQKDHFSYDLKNMLAVIRGIDKVRGMRFQCI